MNPYVAGPMQWQPHAQQQNLQEPPQQQQEHCVGPDGSRGLGSTLASAAHKVHKVELAMHHIAHPGQGLKYHTVDKLKRKVKAKVHGAVNKVVDKVLP